MIRIQLQHQLLLIRKYQNQKNITKVLIIIVTKKIMIQLLLMHLKKVFQLMTKLNKNKEDGVTDTPNTKTNNNAFDESNTQENCTNNETMLNDKMQSNHIINTNNLDDFKFNENDLDEIVNLHNIMEIS